MMDEELLKIKQMLKNKKVKSYVFRTLKESLPSIGYSEKLVEDLLKEFNDLNFKDFQQKYKANLKRIKNSCPLILIEKSFQIYLLRKLS